MDDDSQTNPDVKPSLPIPSPEAAPGDSNTAGVHSDLQKPSVSASADPSARPQTHPSGGDMEMVEAGADANSVRDADNESSELVALIAEKANLERANFNLSTELAQAKDQISDLSSRCKTLEATSATNISELNHRMQLHRSMETSRNDLATRNINLEQEIARLKMDKEERDAAIRSLNKEKSVQLTEVFTLKDQLKEVVDENTTLKLQLAGLEKDKQAFAIVRQQADNDRELFERSKTWFREELARKDNRYEELRTEITAQKYAWQSERMEALNETKKLEAKIVTLEEHLAKKEDALQRVTASLESKTTHHLNEIRALEEEVSAKTELMELLKTRAETAEACAADFEAQIRNHKRILQETKAVLEEVRSDMDSEKSQYMEQISQKDAQIFDLREELEKANACIRNKHSVSINITEDEIAKLSPAAAETSKILKSGMSLSGMMREQARLAGELQAERTKRQQLEEELTEITEAIEEQAPDLLRQKERVDQLFDENSQLRDQIEAADESRRRLQADLDSNKRELHFTRVELQKVQAVNSDLARKQQHLLFVIEKQRESHYMDSVEENGEADAALYESIGQLQRRNMQLEADLASERNSAVHAVASAEKAEIEKLKAELTASKTTEERLTSQLSSLNTAFNSLQDQCDKLAVLVEENVHANDARIARLKADEAKAEASAAEKKIMYLQASIDIVKAERAEAERHCNEKIESNQKLINELTATAYKMEAKFEQQKQLTETILQEQNGAVKDNEILVKENSGLKKVNSENLAKIQELNSLVMEKQKDFEETRVRCAGLTQQLETANLKIHQLQSEVAALESASSSQIAMMTSLTSFNDRLATVQAELAGRNRNRLEALELECEQLKVSLRSANDQIVQNRNDAKLTQTSLEQQLSMMAGQLVERDEELKLSENSLKELRIQLNMIQSQFVSEDSTEGMSPERLKREYQHLKNREQYLEKQCEELSSNIETLTAENSRLKEEAEKLGAYSGKVETGIVETKRLADLERSRLESRAESAEMHAQELSKTIGELKQTIDSKDNELSDIRLKTHEEHSRLQQQVAVCEQRITDFTVEVNRLKESMSNLQQEVDSERNEHNVTRNKCTEYENNASELMLKAELAESRMALIQKELVNKEEMFVKANSDRETAQQALQERIRLAEEAEQRYQNAVNEHDERLKHLQGLYNEVIEKIGSGLDSDPALAGEGIIDPDVPQAVIQSQTRVIQFLRSEKESAVERAMNAEIEARRLRAQANETITNRDQLVSEIARLRAENSAFAGMEVERAELLKKIEALTTSQQQFQRLRADKENLQKLTAELQKKAKEKEVIEASLRKEMEEANVKFAAINSEVGARKRENERLTAVIEQLKQRPVNRSTEAQVSELESRCAELQKQLAKANTDAKQSEEKFTSLTSKHNQTRALAIRYRDRAQELQKENDALKQVQQGATPANAEAKSAADTAATAELETKVSLLESQHRNLIESKKKLEDQLEEKNNDLDILQSRLSLLDTMVKSSDANLKQRDAEIQSLREQVQNLQNQRQAPRIEDVEVHPAPPTHDIPAEVEAPAAVPVDPFARAATSASSSAVQLPHDVQHHQSSAFGRIPASLGIGVMKRPTASPTIDVNTSLPLVSQSSVSPGTSVFGRSTASTTTAPGPRTTAVSTASAQEAPKASTSSAVGSADTFVGAGQSSQVTGSSVAADDIQTDSAGDGESRDSMTSAPVSSSDGRRKRIAAAALESGVSDAKRIRGSPNEAVTSSEERTDASEPQNRVETEAAEELPVVEGVDEDNEDVQQVEDVEQPIDAVDYVEDERPDQEEIVIDDDEESSYISNGDDEDEGEESDEDGEETGDSEGFGPEDEEEENDNSRDVVDSSDRDSGDDAPDVHGDAGNDIEVHGFDDNSRSQPIILDDQEDREAASAMEEADDEGRNSADGTARDEAEDLVDLPSGSGAGRRLRIPIIVNPEREGDDQCSSSNESPSAPSAAQRAMRGRQRGRRGRGTEIYRPPSYYRGSH